MIRLRKYVAQILIGFASAWVLTAMAGCGPSASPVGPATQRDARFQKIARQYREGSYETALLPDLLPYFQARLGRMSASELRRMLGDPRVVLHDDNDYHRYALGPVYGYENTQDPDYRLQGKHDEVWHYGETGPPHRIPDESANLFFVIKDGIVIAVRELG